VLIPCEGFSFVEVCLIVRWLIPQIRPSVDDRVPEMSSRQSHNKDVRVTSAARTTTGKNIRIFSRAILRAITVFRTKFILIS